MFYFFVVFVVFVQSFIFLSVEHRQSSCVTLRVVEPNASIAVY